MDDAPKLDPRTVDDVIAQTEALATAYSGWQPQPRLDLGGALVRLFARMTGQLIQRLNQVPARHHEAFVGLLGAMRIPPRAARAPVSFHLVDGVPGGAEVPAGTQVAAAAPSGEVAYETELALRLTRATLQAVFVLDVGRQRYADRSAIATGVTSGGFDALGVPEARPIEHELYVAADALLALPGATKLDLVVDTKTTPPPDAQKISWSSWDGTSWLALPAATPQGTTWRVTVDPAKALARPVNGVAARWVRGTVPVSAVLPVQLATQVNVAMTGAPAQAAFANAQPVDLSKDVLPFGERPRFGDTFYLGSSDAFALAGATVSVVVAKSPGYPPGGTVKASDDLRLAWEAWDGGKWVLLGTTSKTGPAPASAGFSDSSNAFTASGTIGFTLPFVVPPSTLGGVTSRWIRVRIAAGNYGADITVAGGQAVAATFAAPGLASLALGWSGSRSAAPAQVLRRTELTYEDVTPAAAAGTLVPYRAILETRSALYLGFDRAFEPGLTTLYLKVNAPAAPEPASFGQPLPPRNPPRLGWEYSTGGGTWKTLAVDDGTRSLARSGLVRFVAPIDSVAQPQLGQALFWLRVSPQSDTFSPMPSLGRVLTNTTLVAHTSTGVREILGSSGGARDQKVHLSRTPVLDGQRIEVGEPELPPPAEVAKIASEAGADPISVDTDADGAPLYWVRWLRVPDFWGSGPRDRHYTLDAETGEVGFGDGRRGLVPAIGRQNLRAAWYRAGGGVNGNLAAGAIAQLKTSLAFVDRVTNPVEAVGGADLEPEAERMERASRTIRHGGRAVTAQDFADLALEASTVVARAVTISPSFSPIDQSDGPKTGPDDLHRDGQVILVVVPRAPEPGRAPSVDVLAEVEDYVKARSAPAAQLKVTGPLWVGCDIVAHVVPTSIDRSDGLLVAVRAEIARFLDPIVGGDGRGWPLGRRPRPSDVAACVSALPGVDHLSYLSVKCDAPFDTDDTAQDLNLSLDTLSLYARLLVYARSIEVTPAQPVAVAKVKP